MRAIWLRPLAQLAIGLSLSAALSGHIAILGTGGAASSLQATLVPTVDSPQLSTAEISSAELQFDVPEPEPALDPVPAAPPDPRDPAVWDRPCDGPIISKYGTRDGRPHEGIDVKCPDRGPVAAPLAGTVIQAGQGGQGYGLSVTVDHGSGMTSVFAHLSAVEVRAGQPVEAGQVIGRVGRTGNATTPHVHFEVRAGGRPVNPAPFYD